MNLLKANQSGDHVIWKSLVSLHDMRKERMRTGSQQFTYEKQSCWEKCQVRIGWAALGSSVPGPTLCHTFPGFILLAKETKRHYVPRSGGCIS